jgi:hypothetical protein
MKIMEKATFENFSIRATYTGSKAAQWGNGRENWNHHKVTVTNKDNGLKTSFDFWASIANPNLETEYDILNAFYCFIGDAISGDMTFSEFCGEFGYDEDSRSAERTWKACKRAADKLKRIYDGDIYDLANRLQEIAG